MSNCESYIVECERCGKECCYEDMEFICEMYVCKDCYEALRKKFVAVEEDDGYPD